MSEIVLGEPLASQIRETAEAQGIAVENLIEAAVRQYRFQAQQAKLDAEAEWWRGATPSDQASYAGEYVAVHQREMVDHDPRRRGSTAQCPGSIRNVGCLDLTLRRTT